MKLHISIILAVVSFLCTSVRRPDPALRGPVKKKEVAFPPFFIEVSEMKLESNRESVLTSESLSRFEQEKKQLDKLLDFPEKKSEKPSEDTINRRPQVQQLPCSNLYQYDLINL
ncbi:MAG: hypothetical protein EOO48_14425 [Flavobacterium sp.]|nr:MAG: hypothetical protein EOO48_14425 [Flavobacterium sp.]